MAVENNILIIPDNQDECDLLNSIAVEAIEDSQCLLLKGGKAFTST